MKEASTAASSSDEAIPDNLILLPTQGQNESRTKEDEVFESLESVTQSVWI